MRLRARGRLPRGDRRLLADGGQAAAVGLSRLPDGSRVRWR